MKDLIFIAKLHAQNGFSFYLPTKFVRFFGLAFRTYNNTIYLKTSADSEEISVDATLTKHKEIYKGSFYKWDVKGLKVGIDYLIRIPIK